jgi:hypothetical protein
MAQSRMPVASALGYFEPDPPGVDETGNMLLMAIGLPPHLVTLPSRPPSEPVRVDLLRIVLYCLAIGNGGVVDMNRWASVPVARFQDIAGVRPASDSEEVGMDLRAAGITIAWNPNASGTSGFYTIDTDGTLQPFITSFTIAPAPAEVERAILTQRRKLVAANGSLRQLQVPAFARASAGFPHGFEVKFDARAGGTLVLVRLVVATVAAPDRRPNFAEAVRLVSVREG